MSSTNTYDDPVAHRELVHQPSYDESVEEIFGGNVRRADEAIRGLELWICRRAEKCMAVRGRDPERFGQWVSKIIPPGNYRIHVVFEYDDNTVWLLDARIAPEPVQNQD